MILSYEMADLLSQWESLMELNSEVGNLLSFQRSALRAMHGRRNRKLCETNRGSGAAGITPTFLYKGKTFEGGKYWRT
jgi:hypothetical protein